MAQAAGTNSHRRQDAAATQGLFDMGALGVVSSKHAIKFLFTPDPEGNIRGPFHFRR
jgi:hypothetical protein